MNYASIRSMDISNGLNIGISLFVSGCRNHCKGCFNSEAWDFKFGKEFTPDIKNKIIELSSKPYIKRFSILGGEPMEPENAPEILPLVEEFKELYPDKKIWIYSGYLYENLMKDKITSTILSKCDVLVDGKYEEDKRDLSLKFRGSSNQRIIDLKESTPNNIVLLNL